MKNLKNLSFLIITMLTNSIFSSYVPAAGEETNISQMQKTLKKAQERLLIENISKGNLKEVEKLLKLKADPEIQDEKTNETALALAQRKLQEAESGVESEEQVSNRKLIVDLIKREITNKNLKNPEMRKERKDLEIIQYKKEKLALINLINNLEINVQRFLNKEITENDLKQKEIDFKYEVINYLNKISEKNEANQTALSLAKEYNKIYQYNAKKKMTNLEWSKWMIYGDPVTNFWSNIITTLQNYGARQESQIRQKPLILL